MAVPEVKVKIGADTAGLQDGLNKASGNMRAFAKSAGAAVAKGIAAIGVAAAGAGVALLAFARAQGDVIDANMKTARSLGLTHNQFVAMAQVANEAGVQTSQLSTMLGMMQRNIIELGRGTQAQAEAFGRLGLSMQDILDADGDNPPAPMRAEASEAEKWRPSKVKAARPSSRVTW